MHVSTIWVFLVSGRSDVVSCGNRKGGREDSPEHVHIAFGAHWHGHIMACMSTVVSVVHSDSKIEIRVLK